MIVLFDADSLVYSSCCNVETIEEAIGKFDEVFMANLSPRKSPDNKDEWLNSWESFKNS